MYYGDNYGFTQYIHLGGGGSSPPPPDGKDKPPRLKQVGALLAGVAAIFTIVTKAPEIKELYIEHLKPVLQKGSESETIVYGDPDLSTGLVPPVTDLETSSSEPGAVIIAPVLTPEEEAAKAVTEYFELVKADDVATMWTRLSDNLRREDDPQEHAEFKDWWGSDVLNMDYVVSPSAAPITDTRGGIWVQWAARFHKAVPDETTDANGWSWLYEVNSYRLIKQGDTYLIDDTMDHHRACPGATLEACSSSYHYRLGE